MEGKGRKIFGALMAVGTVLVTASSVPAAERTTGSQSIDGGLVVSSATGVRSVKGSVVAAQGAFTGVGRIVEVPNRKGDSGRVSRDDLVFAAGTIHIVNRNLHASFGVDPKTCRATFTVKQATTIDGGTGRFAGATGTFDGLVRGSGVAGRKADGSCDRQSAPIVEIETITGSGTMTF